MPGICAKDGDARETDDREPELPALNPIEPAQTRHFDQADRRGETQACEPKDFLFQVMRDQNQHWDRRMEAAKALLPYCHGMKGSVKVPRRT